MKLMQEGIALYKEIRSDVKEAVPFFPLGFGNIRQDALAYGLRKEDTVYLVVFAPRTKDVEIPLAFGKETGQVEVIYPKKGNCEYKVEDGILSLHMPQEKTARLLKITLKG